jgi:hypothetical protein
MCLYSLPEDYVVTNASSNATSAVTYTTLMQSEDGGANATFEQTFVVHHEPVSYQFGGLNFTIGPGAVKWSINLTSVSASSVGGAGLMVRYSLSARSSSASAHRRSQHSQRSLVPEITTLHSGVLTTYVIPRAMGTTSVTTLVVFDVALIDGAQRTINHSVDYTVSNSTLSFELVLAFPSFAQSLLYDPSISLGVLTSTHGGGRSSGSDTNLPVIAAATVGGAVGMVALILGTILVITYVKKRRGSTVAVSSHINFGGADAEEMREMKELPPPSRKETQELDFRNQTIYHLEEAEE